MNRAYRKKNQKSGTAVRVRNAIRRILRIPDGGNLVEWQRTFVLLSASLGYLIGIPLNILTTFGPQSAFFYTVNSIHAALILLFVVLYVRRIISVYWAVLLLILSIQIEIPIEMIHMARTEGVIMGIPGILGNTILLGMLLILSITAYIRYLPYVQTFITITALGICWHITQDPHIGQMLPILAMAFSVLSYMGDRLIHGVATLQSSKDDLVREQDRMFEYLNINKGELLHLIRLSRREKLSDRQKSKMLGLLDEQTKASVLEIATDVLETNHRNLAALQARELGLSSYEQKICLMILQGMPVSKIAAKLEKNIPAITSARRTIRAKLKLEKTDELRAVLEKLVTTET
ncbi:hypothetical protein [uncultured Parabacteroides sp.]|uniref:helix-turn-helix transcriptional regulator n=1 Tax=uncultured Parabacteroides sp. TaxID=512312 RepID=UPI0025913BE5|nr:hypothetical protein [uncultured Parabacteroides sp.]